MAAICHRRPAPAALHLGKTIHLWEIRIANDAGQLVCASNLILSIVPRQSTLR